MKWSELVWWIFWRVSLSAAVIGGLIGSVRFPNGTVLVMQFSVPTGLVVGIATGITLPILTRLLYRKGSNLRMNKWIVYVLFMSLNILFMIVFWGIFTIPLGLGLYPLGDLSFYIVVALSPLAALPAIFFARPLVELVEVMQSADNYRQSSLDNNQIILDGKS